MTLRALLPLLFVIAPACGGSPAEKFKLEAIEFATEDGMTIAGDLWHRENNRRAAVLVHSDADDRAVWAPLVPELTATGISVLAVDLRGHGASRHQNGEDLWPRVLDWDIPLFAAMHNDAWGAAKTLEKLGIPLKAIAMVGARTGSSIVIDTVNKHPELGPVLTLTPGSGHMGLTTMVHMRSYVARPTLLVSTEEDKRHGVTPISRFRPDTTEIKTIPGEGLHGTGMLGNVQGLEADLSRWLGKQLDRK